ncbi:hypothetical protein DOP62_14240 (plasmid) [Synechococcus elongatus PCC 11801]|uniref:Uncharacterized protein n=1 Tax=Synechococcus elongatus PCC 11801 TaxID=2219813 RepID=A0ACD5A324_SYNEL
MMQNSNRNRHVMLRLTNEEHRQLKLIASSQQTTVSDLLRSVIYERKAAA